MFTRLLIANRGEIAVRINRTARRLGIATVAVVSEADRGSPVTQFASEVVEIGPGPAAESYLDGEKIIATAKATGAEAIHPGYGFLAENADFAAAVRKAGLTFIGPSPEAMRRMGGKAEAKAIAAAAGVPVVPGYTGEKQDAKTLAREARRIGYPVLIKAVAGGGGRGMRLVEREEDMAAALESAQREALGAFGDGRVLLEKLIASPRHIEVQVFGDRHGNVVHLYERDCSLQRRNQKVIEEAPAPGMPPDLRAAMG
jgi:3-methylcrotonyl-CoA carboxylase alpha subunit